MTDERIAHVLDCGAQDFWDRLFFSADYNRALFLETLKFQSFEVKSQEETPDEIRRVIEAVPPMPELPKVLSAMLKEGLWYREEGVYRRPTRHYLSTVWTRSLSGRLTITGDTFTEPLAEGPFGQGRCLRIHLAHVEAKIFGVGSLLEARLLADMRASYQKAADFTNRWVRQQQPSA